MACSPINIDTDIAGPSTLLFSSVVNYLQETA